MVMIGDPVSEEMFVLHMGAARQLSSGAVNGLV